MTALNVATLCVFAAVLSAVEGPAELNFYDSVREDQAEQAALQDDWVASIRAVLVAAENVTDLSAQASAALSNLTLIQSALTSSLPNNGESPPTEVQDFTFIGSLYFAYTLSTTIGYGTFSPGTDLGQYLTILFSALGICVFTVNLAVLSNSVDIGLDTLVTQIAPRANEGRAKATKSFVTVLVFLVVWFGGAEVYRELIIYDGDDTITYGHAVYYAAITFLTIGLGDYSVPWFGPDREVSVFVFILFTSIGLVSFATLLNLFGSSIVACLSSAKDKVAKRTPMRATALTSATPIGAQIDAPAVAEAVDEAISRAAVWSLLARMRRRRRLKSQRESQAKATTVEGFTSTNSAGDVKADTPPDTPPLPSTPIEPSHGFVAAGPSSASASVAQQSSKRV